MSADAEFVRLLRSLVDRYFRAVDEWETAYSRYFRLSGQHGVSEDLLPLNEEYLRAHRQLSDAVPRARRLCLKYQLRDPWPGLSRAQLGTQASQAQTGSAIGQGERTAVLRCLSELHEQTASAGQPRKPEPVQRGLLHRILAFFL